MHVLALFGENKRPASAYGRIIDDSCESPCEAESGGEPHLLIHLSVSVDIVIYFLLHAVTQ